MDRCWVYGLLVVGLVAGLSQSVWAEAVCYDAAGHFDNREGTLEVWFTPLAKDLYPTPRGDYEHVFSLFEMKVPGVWDMSCSWYARPTRKGLKVSMSSRKMKDGLIGLLSNTTPQDWKPGEKHHVAMTWKGREMKLFADGLCIAHRVQTIPFTGPLGDVQLVLGRLNRKSPVVLHAVRMSCVARSDEALKQAVPQGDLATTLLDVYDSVPDDPKSTHPQISSAMSSQPAGRLVESARWNDKWQGILLDASLRSQ